MAVEIKKYTIDIEKIKRGSFVGFSLLDKKLVLENSDGGVFFSGRFDSNVSLNEWGRIKLFLQLPQQSGQCNYSIAVYISNENTLLHDEKEMTVDSFLHDESIDVFSKLKLFSGEKSLSVKNLSDMILYGVQGRYLWFSLEMHSKGAFTGGELFTPGDAFEEYLPQIYQTDGFFRRYMSMFSSAYLDLERRVEQYPSLLDIDKTSDEMLPVLASWIGLSEICKFVSGNLLREFLRIGFWLNRNRGTTECIFKVVQLFTGYPPTIVERYRFFEEPTQYSHLFTKLYGENNSYFTILLFCDLSEQNYLRLKYLTELFAPAKATARILSIENQIFLDGYVYMDKNAKLVGKIECALGKNQKFDTNSVLM